MRFFQEKFPFSRQNLQISDDLFLINDQVFRILPFSSHIFRIFTMLNVVYAPFLCSSFRARSTTLLLKILGGRMHGPSPHLKFVWGASPQSPLGLRPWCGGAY